ncbi:GDP-6-deoxy-D-mannose reductase [Niveibacterium umoris]|uniref:GDP-4-dehydro-6-deoxy-D-mannose reductase n=1 Tax=Niveibacterium umoris TaxID=1193620 RepID=A0A840BHW9_9RHOO|nr:GDP-mannose 4,6-dehydratase [Niveibacterium umoris]MBB4012825.1 GDP-4-dehydro-6-deoxy-D-mannose reductase [Niveibacterium umoris]
MQGVWVTGRGGFVAPHIAAHAQARGGIKVLSSDLDVRDRDAVATFLQAARPDAIVHLAAQSHVPASFADPRDTLDTNLMGTLSVLQACRDAGFEGRLLFVSSGDVYGLLDPTELPVRESRPARPRNPYAVSKVAAELLCWQWNITEGLDVVIARPFNHIGPGQSERFVVADFARQIIEIRQGKREPVLHVGDIDVTRDFCDVRDIVSAYFALLEKGRRGEIYNVCSGVERTVRSVIERLLSLAGVRADIVQESARLRRAEQRRVQADCSRLQNDTGWRAAIEFDRTLEDILDYWESQLK